MKGEGFKDVGTWHAAVAASQRRRAAPRRRRRRVLTPAPAGRGARVGKRSSLSTFCDKVGKWPRLPNLRTDGSSSGSGRPTHRPRRRAPASRGADDRVLRPRPDRRLGPDADRLDGGADRGGRRRGARLRPAGAGVQGLDALARQLLRQESVGSSRIENLIVGQRRLARAAAGGSGARRDRRPSDRQRARDGAGDRAGDRAAAAHARRHRGDPPHAVRGHRRARGSAGSSARAELDRRLRLQPRRRRLRPAAATSTSRRCSTTSATFLQPRRPAGDAAGRARARAVRDDPPVPRRQRPRRTLPDPRRLPAPRAGDDASSRRSASCWRPTTACTSAGWRPTASAT